MISVVFKRHGEEKGQQSLYDLGLEMKKQELDGRGNEGRAKQPDYDGSSKVCKHLREYSRKHFQDKSLLDLSKRKKGSEMYVMLSPALIPETAD